MNMRNLVDMIIQEHPEFSEEIEGCSEKEITELEKFVTNTTIPQEYREFLQIMGKNPGRIYGIRRKRGSSALEDASNPQMRILFDYTSILSYYRLIQKKKWFGALTICEDYGVDAKNFLLFGIDQRGNDHGNFFLDLRDPNLPVVEISGTIHLQVHWPSFRTFLFAIPFRRILSKFDYSKKYY